MAYIKTNWEEFPSENTPITSANLQKIEDALAGMLDYFYPVGTIYETTSTNLDTIAKMANHFGGTWEVYGAGRVLVAKSADTEFDTIDETGGSKTHKLTIDEMPSHSHTIQSGAKTNAWATPNFVSSYQYQSTEPNIGYTINSAGGNQHHNNLQPYIVVYRYRRTA